MKVSRETAAAHRTAIVEAAARLFREHGFDGVGVAEITRAAGLTHGGFYGHFASKEALAAEACAASFDAILDRLSAADRSLEDYIAGYLSDRHLERRDSGCPMSAYVTDVCRQGAAVQESFAGGVSRYADWFAGRLPGADDDGDAATAARRRTALTIISALVGGLALARAAAAADPALAEEILDSLRATLDDMATKGAERPANAPTDGETP
jgi:TetR/AcrR family transcriptional regulator, transcriptional repressor for nem operon